MSIDRVLELHFILQELHFSTSLQTLLFKLYDFLDSCEKLCHYLKFRDSDGLCADEGEAVTVLGLNINVVFGAQTFQYLDIICQFRKIHYCFNVKPCA